MRKIYIVRLSAEERGLLKDYIKKQKGTSTKVRRAQVLLKADADGPCWTDAEIADAFGCRTKTVENIRERFVTEGFEVSLNGQERKDPPRVRVLDGKQEAKVIALRLGPPPKGYSNWSLRLLAEQVVELGIVDSISYETVRRTLKKTKSRIGRSSTG
jgi:transposase